MLQFQVFLIIGVLLLAKPAGNAVFLARFGPQMLPYMYILTALVAGVISVSYAAALQRYTLLRVNLWSLGICAVSLLGFASLIPQRLLGDVVAVGLYLWVALFGVLAASQFWMMANMVFDVRQAKRLFGPIGAGAIAGGIVGGYAANLVAAAFGIQVLLFVAGCCLVPVIFISIYIWKNCLLEEPGQSSREETESKTSKRPHQLIMASNHLKLLCAIIILSVITAKLVDYQFSALAVERFADPDRLTSFFGFWFSTFNVVGFLIQLLLTQRIVKWAGISGALVVLPAGLSLGAIVMFLFPGLGAATFSRLVDGSLKQSLHRAGVEMLFLPIGKQMKNRIKIFIDVLIDSLAGGIGGLLLIFLGWLGVSAFGTSGLVLVLSLLWGTCVILVRSEYLSAFRTKLSHLRPRQKQRPLSSRHGEVLSGFLHVLEEARLGKSEQQALYVLERAEDLSEDRFQKPIEALLHSPSSLIRARALRNLALRRGLDLRETVIAMLEDEADEVKNAALEYLVTHHLQETEALILEQLQDKSAAIGGTALVHLLLETRGNPELRKRWRLGDIFKQRVTDLTWLVPEQRMAWRYKLLVAAGRSGNSLGNEYIKRELNCPEPAVRKAAILATGESLADEWVFPLIDLLSEPEFRPNATAVLAQYGGRLPAILRRFLKENLLQITDVRRLPRVLERINSPRVIELLFALIERFFPNDLELKLEVLKALNKMQATFPKLQVPAKKVRRHLSLEVRKAKRLIRYIEVQRNLFAHDKLSAREGVLNVLHKRREGSLERIFRLLGMLYAPTDIIPAARGLRSELQSERASALEFLDVLLDNRLHHIMPILEYGVRHSNQVVRNTDQPLPQLTQDELDAFKSILREDDLRLKLSVIHLMGAMRQERYEPLLLQCLTDEDKRIRDVAHKALSLLSVGSWPSN